MSAKHFKSKREIYTTLGLHPNTLDKIIRTVDFPAKTQWGYPRKEALVAVEAYRAREESSLGGVGMGDRQEKTRLECEKLRVVIKREEEFLKVAQLETAQREGELVKADDVQTFYVRKAQHVRSVLENNRAHLKAKHPKFAGQIDDMVDTLIGEMKAGFEHE